MKWRKTSNLFMVFVMMFSLSLPLTSKSAHAVHKESGSRVVVQISAGWNYSLALKPNGTVIGWGLNNHNQAAPPIDLDEVISVSAGDHHSLALKSDGTVIAWGDNGVGESDVPVGLTDVVAIAAGWKHSLALKSDGTVVAWGDNGAGESTVPVGLTDVVSISAGRGHSVALKSDGTVKTWGINYENPPFVTPSLTNIVSISAGTYHTLALRSDGTVVAWGDSHQGGTTVPAGLSGVIAVAAGNLHSLALKSDGTVVAWGSNENGQSTIPANATEVISISAGLNHSLALKSDGTIVAWGDNSSNQLNVYNKDTNPIKGKRIAAGESFTLALKSNGDVFIVGDNDLGQLDVPAGLNDVDSIVASQLHALALKSDGTVVGWGDNSSGQLDIPNGLSNVASIATGKSHSLALKSNGNVVGWGDNSANQITFPDGMNAVVEIAAGEAHSLALLSNGTVMGFGDNSFGQIDIPVGLDKVVAIAVGSFHSMALQADGTVVAWGDDGAGQITIPAGLSAVASIAAGESNSVALKTDGTVVAWGSNDNGQTDVPSDLNAVNSIAVGSGHMVALKADGNVIAWGNDIAGEASIPGDNNLSDLTVDIGQFVEPFDANTTEYTHYFNGHLRSELQLTATLVDSMYTAWYVDNEFYASGSAVTIDVQNVQNTLNVPIQVEPYLLPGKTYTVTLENDITAPEVQFDPNGTDSDDELFISNVTIADSQSGVDANSLQYVWTQSTDVPSTGWLPFADGDALSHASGNSDWFLHVKATDNVGNEVYEISDAFYADIPTPTPTIKPTPTTQPVYQSSNANLVQLDVYHSTEKLQLTPIFSQEITNYKLETEEEKVELHLEAASNAAIVKVLGENVEKTSNVTLKVGINVFDITVQAENGTIKTYTVTITRKVAPTVPVCTFTDIKDHWAKVDICEAVALGIVEGMNTNTFMPDGYVSRAEFAVMLMRTLQIPINNEAPATTFRDRDDIPEWARLSIQTATSVGILDGYLDGSLLPQRTVSRTELAIMIARAMAWETKGIVNTPFADDAKIPAWGKAYVEVTRKHGLMLGLKDNRFAPEGQTTRAEATVVLLRLWKLIHQ
ncbi:S-layer homology domain-containing protein [Paenibacillus endoradicis]|uniref:S-layer homology domain-containing protein n=1 Tax=Paenibacillus endoradicis TaxID=2972487 RepID=UPI0021598442|nr:S-layer homology domain-containing protein [Paenibacillus endoradicis]MCR8658644.1 S-layer homology domain-containing protein [Paenibacillus endoradicis]